MVIIRVAVLILVAFVVHYTLADAGNLDALTEEFWTWRLDNSPEFGTKFGINNHDDQLAQFTETGFYKTEERSRGPLEENKPNRGR